MHEIRPPGDAGIVVAEPSSSTSDVSIRDPPFATFHHTTFFRSSKGRDRIRRLLERPDGKVQSRITILTEDVQSQRTKYWTISFRVSLTRTRRMSLIWQRSRPLRTSMTPESWLFSVSRPLDSISKPGGGG
ncbi:hypothetical protein SCHPADRAFT_700915 [Schizopora paradoxa]|uniref:Uncharacterized protein n=1 Tax=Schizopora paradoxa TaxID=27342 RepID=A0A0H2RMM5_9AGAM|nr:hypothetical protein SCHPADRAFT_700915 [Schizopora paradoxa]